MYKLVGLKREELVTKRSRISGVLRFVWLKYAVGMCALFFGLGGVTDGC